MDENNASQIEPTPFAWLNKNKEWLFQGGGVTIVMGVAWVFSSKWSNATAQNANDAEKLTLALMMAMAVLSIAICIFLAYRALQANRSRILLVKRLDTIDKKLKSIEAPRRFEDWNKAQPEIQRLIKNSFVDFQVTEIQCLGVALHVSWKTVRECLEDYKKTYGKFPNATIRLKVLSPEWRHWEKLGRAWRRRNEAFYESVTDFLQMSRGGETLQINVTDYDSTPNWHGVLINGRHLFAPVACTGTTNSQCIRILMFTSARKKMSIPTCRFLSFSTGSITNQEVGRLMIWSRFARPGGFLL